MGASTYSTESPIEHQFYVLKESHLLLPTRKEITLLNDYSSSYQYLALINSKLPKHTLLSMESAISELAAILDIYSHIEHGAEGFCNVIKCCFSSGSFEKANQYNTKSFIEKLLYKDEEECNIESIPFDFKGFSKSIYNCIQFMWALDVFITYLEENSISKQIDLLQNSPNNQNMLPQISTESLSKLRTIVAHLAANSLISDIFAVSKNLCTSVFYWICRFACVICITIHNNIFIDEEKALPLFRSLRITIMLCEEFCSRLSTKHYSLFPIKLVMNTLISLCKSKESIQVHCKMAINQLKKSPKLYSLAEEIMRQAFELV